METAPRTVGEMAVEPSTLEAPLGFALNFISGKGLLTTRDRRAGPFELKVLELEIPRISFPFDVTGGADRFKTRRCVLRTLALALDAESLGRVLASSSLEAAGFLELRAALRDGCVELAGRFALGDHRADFTMRAALLVRSPEELGAVFYDTRVYGWLPVPAPLLPVFLRRALDVPFIGGERAGVWLLRPAEHFLRELLPRVGWKIPDTSRAALVGAEIGAGRLVVAVGTEGDPTARQLVERQPPVAAALAGEGIALFDAAEQALGHGDIQSAYEKYREALDDERGGRWARERLLQIGAADPELAVETRQLAEELLAQDPQDVQALLALAAIATRERSWGEAANRYDALGQIARARKERFDAVAAELASAAAAAPIDPAAAIAAYERAAARSRDSVIAHQALFELYGVRDEWGKSAKAGERLIRLERDGARRAAIHRRLGAIYHAHVNDLRRARVHFERALRLSPDDPAALEGLAETYASRGEPARAAAYLARLAAQADEAGDVARITTLNLRLGEIWERWLGDVAAASVRYLRVLDVEPRHRVARMRLAELAERGGDVARARTMYEELVALEEDRDDPAAIGDVVTAYTRLARITLQSEGLTAEAIASLERAVELDPAHRGARDELSRVLRERGEWTRLGQLLEQAARFSRDPEEARRSRLDAARLELHRRGDAAAAQRHLEAVLGQTPDDPEALDLLVPLLQGAQDHVALMERMAAAADATAEPVRRGRYLLELARARAALGLEPEARRRALEDALDANPYLVDAAEMLVELLADHQDHERLVKALGRLAVATTSAEVRAEALLRQGRILWQELRRPTEAEEALREAVRLEPGNLATWTALSRLLEIAGKTEEAWSALERALDEAQRRGANRAPLHERMAELARTLERPEEEARQLSLAIAAGLRTERIGNRLVQVLSQLGRIHDAASLLEEWAGDGAGRENELMLFKAAELRRSLGEVERASSLYHRLLLQRGEAALPAARALERIARERGNLTGIVEALEYQVEQADETQRAALLERLVEAYAQRTNFDLLERTARRLLELDQRSLTAHWHLAQCLLRIDNFHEALFHLERMLLDGPRNAEQAALRRRAYELGAGLALEIEATALLRLQEAFESEHPDAPAGTLERPWGELLAERGEWSALLALRRSQIDHVGQERAAVLRREMADILHHELGRSEEAIPYYQDVIAAAPDDLGARDALVAVFERLGRWGDLANHLFALSQVVSDPAQAFEYGLRSVEVYTQRVHDQAAGTQVLRTLVSAGGLDPENDRLMRALRDLDMHSELTHVLAASLEARPIPDDGRLRELVVLLEGPLDDAAEALRWAERFIESHPSADAPWEAAVEVLAAHPDLGEARALLERWAAAREGRERARVLVCLAEHLRDGGDEVEALQALERAAACDASDETVLVKLVERYTARGDWVEAQRWLERLAFATPAGPSRDERLRRLVEVASDYTDDARLAIRGLESLEAPTPEELQHLAQLYVDVGDAAGIVAKLDAVRRLPAAALVAAGRALAEVGDFERAKELLTAAAQYGAERDAWEIAERLWKEAGRAEELARWRLEYAAVASSDMARVLRLEAFAELVAAGAPPPIAELKSELESADLGDARTAWTVFRAARASGLSEAAETAAAALESALPEDDARRIEVLVVRARHELDRGDYDAAVRLAQQLVDAGSPGAEVLLDEALTRAGRVDDLVAHLSRRARLLETAAAAAIWRRVAALHVSRGDTGEALAALLEVATEHRDRSWAELAFTTAGDTKEVAVQVEAATIRAREESEPSVQAEWLRRAAHLSWWKLDDAERARELLTQAQALAPRTTEFFLEAAARAIVTGDAELAEQQLQEALAVLDGADAVPIWLQMSGLHQGTGDRARALAALREAASHAAATPALLGDVGRRARELGDLDLAVEVLAAGLRHDAALETALAETLEAAERWEQLVVFLERRAEETTGHEAAGRFERAASIVSERFGDRERVVRLLERAVRAEPRRDNLEAAFALACELQRPTLIAALAEPLLKRLPEDDAERWTTMRAWIDALEHLGLEDETVALRERLIAAGVATADDKLALSRLLAEREPGRAAGYLAEAATDPALAQRPEVLVSAARAWIDAGDVSAARPLVEQALERGFDTVEAHALAVELFEGEAKLASLLRLVELGGDGEWADDERAGRRLELARWRRERGEPDQARWLLEEAVRFARLPGWAEAMEGVLEAQGREAELVRLWLDEAPRATWSGAALEERLRRAVELLHARGDAAGEYRVLDLLARERPDDEDVRQRLVAAAAELGDRDAFVARIDEQLEQAADAAARAELALRYHQVLTERFDDADAALALLVRAFDEAPTLALADAIRASMLRQGGADDLVELLRRGAGRAASEVRIALLEAAADVARGEAGDAEAAYEILREVLEITPAAREARDWCIRHVDANARWGELIELLRGGAAVAEDPHAAYDLSIRASHVAREALRDATLEAELLSAAAALGPPRPDDLRRLFELRLEAGELDAARAVLTSDGWTASAEIDATRALAHALRAAGREEDAEALGEWGAERHPETNEAADVRLRKARRDRDYEAVLGEIDARLGRSKELKPGEWTSLHREAGEAALALGDGVTALKHYVAVVDTPDPEPEAIRRAAELAVEIGDENRLSFILQSAANVRELITTRAIEARGAERSAWFVLLGQADEGAGDAAAAAEAYRQAIELAGGDMPEQAFQALARLYRKGGEWQHLVSLYEERIGRGAEPAERVLCLYQMGLIWRDSLGDEDRAEECLARALEAEPAYAAAQLAYGLLLHGRRRYAEALPYLRAQVDGGASAHRLALLDCLRHAGATEDALSLLDSILEREPELAELRAVRAELLEASGRTDEAAAEWSAYLDAAAPTVEPATAAAIHLRLARFATQRGDEGEALRRFDLAQQHQPDNLEAVSALRALYETAADWQQVIALRTRELALVGDLPTRMAHLKRVAEIYRDELGDLPRATATLERAIDADPDDVEVLRALFALHAIADDGRKLLVVGERLLAREGEEAFDAESFMRLARAYEETAGEPVRATELYGKAFALAPQDATLRDKYRDLAREIGDYAAFAPLEEEAIESLADPAEQARRYRELADVYARYLANPAAAASALQRARELAPNDTAMLRQLADAYALDPATYGEAAEAYRKLLASDLLNPELLRILARLSGQLGDTDRAYGYYAALLVLAPSDAEATRFVTACRNAMPPGPQRAVTDADRTQGLIHADQLGVIEELFAPLARFAELTHAGNLKLRGIDARDQLGPTDERAKWLLRVLEPLGLPQAALYLWRGGGYGCDVELVGTPALLLGSTLASDASQRQRAFLVARAAELYRSGHTLCERLGPGELEALLAALCMALVPGSTAPGAGASSAAWAQAIAAPMTDQIRGALAPRAQAYVEKFASLDLGKWRRGCLASANRVALLVSCDIEDAISAMLRVRGRDDATEEQRRAVLAESPEELDVLRFALSDAYFKLREGLGLALRRAK